MFWLSRLSAILIIFQITSASGAEVSKRDEKGKLVLENEYVRAAIDPMNGATLVSFVRKSDNAELLTGPSFLDTNILPGRRLQSLDKLSFAVTERLGVPVPGQAAWLLSARLPNEAPIDFSGQMVGRAYEAITYNPSALLDWPRPYQNLNFLKRFRLKTESRALLVDYEITNEGDKALTLCLGTTHAFAGFALSLPTRDGAAHFRLPLVNPKMMPLLEHTLAPWLYDVPGAWMGMLQKDGSGLVGAFDARHISFLKPDLSSRKVTFGRTRVRLEPGKVFSTSGWIMPVKGFSRVVSAEGALAADFQVTPKQADGTASLERKEFAQKLPTDLEKMQLPLDSTGDGEKPGLEARPPAAGDLDDSNFTPEEQLAAELEGEDILNRVKTAYEGPAIGVRLNLVSARTRDVEISIRTRKNLHGNWRSLVERSARLLSGNVTPVELELKPKEVGTHLIQAIIREGDNEVARFEHPVIAHHPSGFYLPAAPKREGEINRDFYYWHVGGKPLWPYEVGWQPSMEIERPHFDLASPLAGGPVKALFILPHKRTREVIELANRMDLDYECVTTGVRGYGSKTKGGRKRAAIDEIDFCRSFLNKPHEVIVLPILLGQWLTQDIVEEIARQVREDGIGLVFALPEQQFGSFAEFNRRAKADEDCPPKFRRAQIGKGRVVFLDGNSQELFTNWMCGEIQMRDDKVSDFAKMLLWAARGEPKLAIELAAPARRKGIERTSLGDPAFQIEIHNDGSKAFKGKLKVVMRQNLEADYPFYPRSEMLRSYRVCRLWDDRGTMESGIEISPGKSKSVPVSMPVPGGSFSLDAYVLDEGGATAVWERFALQFAAQTDITSINLIRGVRTPREIDFKNLKDRQRDLLFTAKPTATLELSCKLSNAENVERIVLVATDPWDRLIASQEKKLDPGPAERSVSFSFPLKSCLHRVLIVSLRAYDATGCVRDRRLCGFIHPRPDRRPAYEFRAYANASEVDRSLTGYDTRVGAAPFSRALLHAWFNVSIQAWFSGPPSAERVTIPGEVIDKPPEFPLIGPISEEDQTGDAAGIDGAAVDQTEAEEEEIEAIVEERKPVDPRDGWVRLPCINDPAIRSSMFSEVRGLYKMQNYFGPFSGGMGDEWYVTKEGYLQNKINPWRRNFVPGKDTNSCRCPHCLELFKDYAKKLFDGNLAALNSEWGTAFKDWQEVDRPIVNKTVDDFEAPSKSQWAYIIDHRRFDDYRVADLVRGLRDIAKGEDIQNRFGWGDVFKSGIWSGIDSYLISPFCDNNQLDRDQIRWASFGSPTNAHWVGYHKKYGKIRENFTAWWMMFRGNTSITYYGKSHYPMHLPDFTFMDAPKEMFRSMHEIRELGFDKLLVGHPQIDPVAIHYDPSSIYIAQLEEWREDPKRFAAGMRNGGRSFNELCHQIEQSYQGLLRGRGLQYFATAYGQLEEGHFGRYGTPKLLFLPYTQCISKKQADTLEKFVKEGGVLVGDIHTGLRNGHGKRLASGNLDHLFGIQRKKSEHDLRVRADAKGNPVTVRFGRQFGEPFDLSFSTVGPGDVVADTATALADYSLDGEKHPAFLVNEFGKGKAIYLNFTATGYRIVLDEGRSDEVEVDIQKLKGLAAERFQRMFGKIISYAELRSPVKISGATLWRFGNELATYICLGAGYKGNPNRWRKPYNVCLAEKRHVYDSRRRKYIGFTDSFEARFSIEQKLFALVYAALPYKVEGIVIESKAETVIRGETLFFKARLQPAEATKNRHLLSMRVTNPRGEDVRWYGTVMETKNGVASGRIDSALNDLTGEWRLQLTDTATGVSASKDFQVK